MGMKAKEKKTCIRWLDVYTSTHRWKDNGVIRHKIITNTFHEFKKKQDWGFQQLTGNYKSTEK